MKKKECIFSFKTDEELAESLNALPNRSEFIRNAVQAALDQQCPLCRGTGSLTEQQKEHLDEFLNLHALEKCDTCQAIHFVCKPHKTTGLH